MSDNVIPLPVRLRPVEPTPNVPCICDGGGYVTARRIDVPRFSVHLRCAATDHSKENRP